MKRILLVPTFLIGLMLGNEFITPVLAKYVGLNLVSPTANQVLSGTVTFYAQANGPGIKSIQFKLDGIDYGSVITSGSCFVPFDTTKYNDGSHKVQVVGLDEFNNPVPSAIIDVSINNAAVPNPTPTPIPQISLTLTNPKPDTNFLSGSILQYTFDYVGVTNYTLDILDSNNVIVANRSRITDGTSPDTSEVSLVVGGGNNTPIPDGTYTLRLSAGSVSTSIRFTIGSVPIPTPTPIPTPDPVLTAIQGVSNQVSGLGSSISSQINLFSTKTNADLQILMSNMGSLNQTALSSMQQVIRQELALALTPTVPPTCNLEIRSIGTNYADGDYRVTFKVSKLCAAPVVNSIWKSLNIK